MFEYTPLWFNVAVLIVIQTITHYWSVRASDSIMRVTGTVVSLASGIIAGLVIGLWMWSPGVLK